MWQLSTSFCTEPKELRSLKEQLAQVNCKCNLCYTYDASLRQFSDSFLEDIKYTKEVETQSEGKVNLQEEYIYNHVLCPTCCMTMNLLRGGTVRILKDEESETLASMFTSDKATNKGFMSQETIFVLKNMQQKEPSSQSSNLTLCDFPTKTSSAVTIRPSKSIRNPSRKRCLDKVTFQNVHFEYPAKPQKFSECVCLEDYVDSIRPPLN